MCFIISSTKHSNISRCTTQRHGTERWRLEPGSMHSQSTSFSAKVNITLYTPCLSHFFKSGTGCSGSIVHITLNHLFPNTHTTNIIYVAHLGIKYWVFFSAVWVEWESHFKMDYVVSLPLQYLACTGTLIVRCQILWLKYEVRKWGSLSQRKGFWCRYVWCMWIIMDCQISRYKCIFLLTNI